MSAIKERLIGAITVMDENEALLLWEDIQSTYTKRDDLSEVDTVEPTEDELKILDAFEHGDADYQPSISADSLKKELGL